MVFNKSSGSVESLFFAAPMADYDGAFRIWIYFFEDACRLHHSDRTRTIVGGSGGPVPRIKMGREDNIFIGKLFSRDGSDGVESRYFAQFLRFGDHFYFWRIAVLDHTIYHTIIFEGKIYYRNFFGIGSKNFISPKPFRPTGLDNAYSTF